MQCVYLDDRLPNGFEEQFFYSEQMPYTIGIKRFQTEDIVPLHYAETIEILLCDELCGEMIINNNRFALGGRQLFVIPPYTVHGNNIRSCGGGMYVFKINFHEMERFINIENYLESCGCRADQLLYRCPAYDEILKIVEGLIENDGDLPRCVPLILDAIYVLSRHVDKTRTASSMNVRFKESGLQELIHWTYQNFARRITIEEAAAMTGYSKYYFCSRFRELTGLTYMNYLNSIRVSQACLLLRNGEPIQEVSRKTGFENVSYFIQVFKRIQHMTPHQYARQEKKPASGGKRFS